MTPGSKKPKPSRYDYMFVSAACVIAGAAVLIAFGAMISLAIDEFGFVAVLCIAGFVVLAAVGAYFGNMAYNHDYGEKEETFTVKMYNGPPPIPKRRFNVKED